MENLINKHTEAINKIVECKNRLLKIASPKNSFIEIGLKTIILNVEFIEHKNHIEIKSIYHNGENIFNLVTSKIISDIDSILMDILEKEKYTI